MIFYIKKFLLMKAILGEASGTITEEQINKLIDAKLGVIENGSY